MLGSRHESGNFKTRKATDLAHPDVILKALGAGARKRWSQNFLISSHWATKLTERALAPTAVDEIWEIGPGLGALSRLVLEKAKVPVRVFEIDPKLSEYLRGEFPGIQLTEGDFLDFDLSVLREKGLKISLLSNLPYHLSSPILFRWIEYADHLAQAVFTFQREFAERLYAAPRSESYGALSVLAQAAFKIERLGILPEGAFFPAPSVQSEALVLVPQPMEHWEVLSAVVHAAFQQRRKKMVSNLKQAYRECAVEGWLAELNLDPNVRAEMLSLEEFRAIVKNVFRAGDETKVVSKAGNRR